MTTEPTSAAAGVTPNADPQPATGNASGSATQPTKPTLTVEELLKLNAELEHSHKNAREQADRQAKQLEKYQKQEKEAAAAKEAADLAQLSEIERIKKQHEASEQRIKLYQQQLVMAQVKLAAKDKNIVDPDLAALAIQDKLEMDENGMPSNLEKVLDDLIKNKPYLVMKPDAPATPPTTPAQTAPTPNAPAIPAM